MSYLEEQGCAIDSVFMFLQGHLTNCLGSQEEGLRPSHACGSITSHAAVTLTSGTLQL